MIEEFVGVWDEHKDDLEAKYREKCPGSYEDIFTDVSREWMMRVYNVY